ncbi:MAG: hypothetical protein MJ016_02290 [Victivallaceae bacterium]|nr:hypothetical protein [Victivallaceae bacterium]
MNEYILKELIIVWLIASVFFVLLYILQRKKFFQCWCFFSAIPLILFIYAFLCFIEDQSLWDLVAGFPLLLAFLLPGLGENKYFSRLFQNIFRFFKIAFSKENYFRTSVLLLLLVIAISLAVIACNTSRKKSPVDYHRRIPRKHKRYY